LQARGEVHGVAERRRASARATNLRDDRETGIDANPHLGPHAVFDFDRGRGRGEAFVYKQPGAACT
jgi:hypothetical protein